MRPRRFAALALLLPLLGGAAPAAGAEDFAAALRAAYEDAQARLRDNPFGRPLYLDSGEADGALAGSIHAQLDQRFETLRDTLADPARWCDVLLLLPNIAACRAQAGEGPALEVGLVRRFDAAPRDATAVRFAFATRRAEGGLQVELQAPQGPLGTHDYRIAVEAIPLPDGRSFLHLRYAYAYGWTARLAAQGYLGTSGRGKVGFSRPDGGDYVGGLRGAVERNAMRCYLAIESTLAGGGFEPSLRRWLDAVGGYPRQLAEEDPGGYFAAKLRDAQLLSR